MRSLARRDVLRLGALGGLGFWAGPGRAFASPRAKAKSVILIFNCGGPSHLDLWDPKPDAGDDIRGPFRPIGTNVAGLRVSELLPGVAKRADKLAVVRSVHHTQSSHNAAMYWSITGRPYPVDSTLINPGRTDIPSVGTLVGWLSQRSGRGAAMPPYVITPAPHCDSTRYITPGQYGGCLGPAYDPFVLNADPNAADFKVEGLSPTSELPAGRLGARRELLGLLDRHGRGVDVPLAREMDVYGEKAFSMVTSGRAAEAFDLSKEPAKVRDRYGRHPWGQSHLLARRLVEAGVPFVTTVNGQSIVWDTHQDNFNRLKDKLVPPMEQAYCALLDDLSERGLLDSTLVFWMGDFGRTPVINKDAGRDHWPHCFSAVMAGGGVPGGQVVGSSDESGARPDSRPVTPADLHATVLAALGHDPKATFLTTDGRPLPLSEGEPIRELL
jgi:hypothetical protein